MLRRGADKVQRQGQAEPACNLSAADIGIGDGCRLCIEENKFVVRSINCVGELPTTAHPNARKCDNCRTCRNIVRASRRYACTTANHKHHERVVIAGKGVEALKKLSLEAARERNARRRLQRDGLRDSTKRIRQVVLHADKAAREVPGPKLGSPGIPGNDKPNPLESKSNAHPGSPISRCGG